MAAPMDGYSARMHAATPTFDDLVDQLRLNASTDVQFPQRVALVCCHLVPTKDDAGSALRTMFRIR